MSCANKLHGGKKGKYTKRITGKRCKKSNRKTAKKHVKKTSKRRSFFARLFNR
jgi:hypothetical protein